MHGVDADLGEQPVLVVEEVTDVAVGAQPDHGPYVPVADAGADQGGEFVREGVGERGADLVAHAGGDGELEVPAGVGASGAAAEGDGGRGEAQVGGVVVGGVEVGDAPVPHGRDAADAGQVGQGCVVGLVLSLDLAFGVRHAPNLVAVGAERQWAAPHR